MKRPIYEPEALYGRPGFVTEKLGGAPAVGCFSRNEKGKDYVVGDIHGMFALLQESLDDLGFDPDKDRLFAVGDLVDRGPKPELALDWLCNKTWFHSIRGNHDQFLIDITAGAGPDEVDLWSQNGGDWWKDLPEADKPLFIEAFGTLPFAIQVECEEGLVGIVHADVPEDRTWQEFCLELRSGSREDSYHAIWSRRRWNTMRHGFPELVPPVEGILHGFCGHTPVHEPTQYGNLWNIDTGAAYAHRLPDAKFTIARIHPGPLEFFHYRTPKPTILPH